MKHPENVRGFQRFVSHILQIPRETMTPLRNIWVHNDAPTQKDCSILKEGALYRVSLPRLTQDSIVT